MDTTAQAQEKAKEAAGQARNTLRDQVDQRSTQAGEQITGMAGDVRTVAGELRNQGKEAPARYAEKAAERVERAGRWLEESDGDRILSDAEDFARRNPWAVAAGGLVLGLAAARMLKASSGERYRASLTRGSGNGASAADPRPGRRTDLAAEPMPSGADTSGARFTRDEGSVDLAGSTISAPPRT